MPCLTSSGRSERRTLEPFHAAAAADFAERLQEKVGREILVIIDEVDEEGAIGRSMADAPEIDGAVYLNGETNVKPGDILRVKVEHADEYDLWGSRV